MHPFRLILFALSLLLPHVARADRPNIVFFYIDDLGWSDLACQGSDFYETPNIDRLAASGTVFTDAYSCGPNCAPSRACLLSGLYSPRHGIFTVGDPRRGNHAFRRLEPIENKTTLADSFVTWAEVLGANGYTLASMGKWHLGNDPTTQGFHVNVAGKEWGSPRGGGGYHSPYDFPNLKQEQPGEYLTDRLTDEALRFIDQNQEMPFLLYLTHYAVHTPIQAKQDIVAKYEAKAPGKYHWNTTYAAMIESVDQSVGRVLTCLEERDLAENTVIIFSSDNGGYVKATSNHPLRGAKGMLYEGGVRVPLIICWPGVTVAGSRCAEPVIGIDLYPTFVDMSACELPENVPLDGRSLVPLLKDSTSMLSRAAIFWHFPAYLEWRGDARGGPFRTTPAGAVRQGDWKLIEWFETGRRELYNLRDDIGESNDLAASHPAKVDELSLTMRNWRLDVNAPVPTEKNPLYDPDRQDSR